MVPAYTMPANIEQIVVMRVLCKQGFSRDMADQLLADIRFAVDELNALEYPTPPASRWKRMCRSQPRHSTTRVSNSAPI